MPILEIPTDMHNTIRFYCLVHKIKIKNYVKQVFEKELKEFKKQMEDIKFK